MSKEAALAAQVRRRYAETDTHVLLDQWSSDDRTDWAEAALHEELIERGIAPRMLDELAARRMEIATNPRPAVGDLWTIYWTLGGLAAVIATYLWCKLEDAIIGSSSIAWLGSAIIWIAFSTLLTRRTRLQTQHTSDGYTRIRMGINLVVSWTIIAVCLFMAISSAL